MKLLLLPFAASFLCLGALRADTIIVEKIEGVGQAGEMTMKMKDNKSRIDIPPAVSMITDKDTGDMITIMHAQKVYMKMSGAATKALIEQVRKATPGGDTPPKLTATGKKEKINGYDTEEYTTSIGAMKMSYWVAPNYPDYKSVLSEMMKFQKGSLSSVTKGMAPAAEDFTGMPIRTRMDNGARTTTTTLVSVTSGTVDPKEFNIPDGYKELPMPSFGAPPAAAKTP